MKNGEKWLHRIFPLILLIFGIIAMFSGISDLKNGLSSYRWSSADARVVESRIGQTGRGSSKSSRKKFTPHIQYSYYLDGQQYFSERISFGPPPRSRLFASSASNAKAWVDKHPAGSHMKVYFNPANKSQSVIINGVRLSMFFLPTLGIMLTLGGMAIIKNCKKKRATVGN